MRSLIAITSGILCVMNGTDATPSLAIFCRDFINPFFSTGDNIEVGSSMIRIFAPRKRALSISTLCFSPIESCQGLALRSTSSLNFFWSSIIFFSACLVSRKGPLKGSYPSIIFSLTVSVGTSIMSWGIIPMPKFIASFGDLIDTLFPRTRISPSSIR